MKAIIKIPIDPVGQIRDIPNDLRYLQELVGGHIETVTLSPDFTVIVNEEGRLFNMRYNCMLNNLVDLYGTVVVVGVDGDKFTDVPITLEAWKKWIS